MPRQGQFESEITWWHYHLERFFDSFIFFVTWDIRKKMCNALTLLKWDLWWLTCLITVSGWPIQGVWRVEVFLHKELAAIRKNKDVSIRERCWIGNTCGDQFCQLAYFLTMWLLCRATRVKLESHHKRVEANKRETQVWVPYLCRLDVDDSQCIWSKLL